MCTKSSAGGNWLQAQPELAMRWNVGRIATPPQKKGAPSASRAQEEEEQEEAEEEEGQATVEE